MARHSGWSVVATLTLVRVMSLRDFYCDYYYVLHVPVGTRVRFYYAPVPVAVFTKRIIATMSLVELRCYSNE